MQPRNRASRIERLNRLEQKHLPNGGLVLVLRVEGKTDDYAIDQYCRRHDISEEQRRRCCFVMLTKEDCLL